MSAARERWLPVYRRAVYRVGDVESGFTLSPDQPSAGLRALFAEHGVDTAAFLTACNPGSRALGAAANAERTARLDAELAARGLQWRAGEGADPDGDWPPEPSRLVLGMARDQAQALARAFGQNAMLWIGPDAVPRLVWTGETDMEDSR